MIDPSQDILTRRRWLQRAGGGFGLIGDIVVGIIGSVIAGYLLPLIGIHLGAGFIRSVVNAVIGACLLLTVVRLVVR